jgi:hypothetical protein
LRAIWNIATRSVIAPLRSLFEDKITVDHSAVSIV